MPSPAIKVFHVEKTYWLARQQAAGRLAIASTSSRARLAHYELAGRYSVKAAEAPQSSHLARRMALSRAIASSSAQQPPLVSMSSDALLSPHPFRSVVR